MPALPLALRVALGSVVLSAGYVALDRVRTVGAERSQRRLRGPADVGLASEDVELTSTVGSRLHAWWVPAGPGPAPVVLLVHGLASHAGDLLPLAPLLHGAGFHVLLLDLRGHGRSEHPGDRPRPPHLVDDVATAITWVRRRDDVRGIGLVGHSIGGSVALQAAAGDTRIAAVVAVAAVADPTLSRIGWWPAWVSRVLLATIARREGIDPTRTFAVRRIRDVRARVLLVHGESDRVIPVVHAHALRRARPDAELVLVPDAGHASFDAFAPAMERALDFLGGALRS